MRERQIRKTEGPTEKQRQTVRQRKTGRKRIKYSYNTVPYPFTLLTGNRRQDTPQTR